MFKNIKTFESRVENKGGTMYNMYIMIIKYKKRITCIVRLICTRNNLSFLKKKMVVFNLP